jgi:hypothetical protein
MRLTEARLKQIIREEIELRIVKQAITEVITEMQLGLTEEQTILLEQSVLDALKNAVGNNTKLLLFMAATAFGSQIGNDLQVLDKVGVTPAAAAQMQSAEDAGDYIRALKDKNLQDRVQAAMDRGTADLGKDLSDTGRKEVVDNFISNHSGDFKLLQVGSGPITDKMGNLYYYVPYGKIIDKDATYTDYTTGPEGIDGKRTRYQQNSTSTLKNVLKGGNINLFAHYGPGKFVTVDGPNGPGKLLTADFSAFVQGYLDKMQARSPEGRAAAADADVAMTVTADSEAPELDPELIKKTQQRADKNTKKLQQKRK